VIDREIGAALAGFQGKVRKTPEISAFFANARQMDQVSAHHWRAIAEVEFMNAQTLRRTSKM